MNLNVVIPIQAIMLMKQAHTMQQLVRDVCMVVTRIVSNGYDLDCLILKTNIGIATIWLVMDNLQNVSVFWSGMPENI